MITNKYINYICRSDSDGMCTIDDNEVPGSENMKRGSQGRGAGWGHGRGHTSLAPGKLPSSVIKLKKTEQKQAENLDLDEQPKKEMKQKQ